MKLKTASIVLWIAALVWLLCGACAWSLLAAGGVELTGRVQAHQNYDTRNIQTYSIHFGADNGTITVLGDADVPFMQQLSRVGKGRIRITVEAIQPESLAR